MADKGVSEFRQRAGFAGGVDVHLLALGVEPREGVGVLVVGHGKDQRIKIPVRRNVNPWWGQLESVLVAPRLPAWGRP